MLLDIPHDIIEDIVATIPGFFFNQVSTFLRVNEGITDRPLRLVRYMPKSMLASLAPIQ